MPSKFLDTLAAHNYVSGAFKLFKEVYMSRIRKNYLITPGPTAVPPEVALAGAIPFNHHRTPRFSTIVKKVGEGLKELFQTKNDVYIMACSGTGVMEAAVANLVSSGDKIIVAEAGKFGERWVKIAKGYGAEIVHVNKPMGEVITPEDVKAALDKNPDAKVVFVQLSETSTGCVYDVEGISKVVSKTNAVFVVDGISGVGAVPCYQDKWGIDALISASQKGFMLPPGLTFISVSKKAWGLIETAKSPRFYFDLRESRKSFEKDTTPWTPCISLILQLEKSLEMLLEEGVENVWRRHAWLAEATRAAATALNLKLFAKRTGNILTSIVVPDGIDGNAIAKTMRDKYGVQISNGQGELKGKILRIGHLGYVDRFDVIIAISALEMTLKDLGFRLELGVGVKAAEEILCREP